MQGNTNSQGKLYISTSQTADLDLAGFTALVWTQVKGVGNIGEMGRNQTILKYDTWDSPVALAAKGMIDAGSPEVELNRDSADAGQDALRAAALVNLPYAIKVEYNDKLTSGGTPTIRYNRALVVGPRVPNGRNEDFMLEVFTLGMTQLEVVADPT